MSQPKILPLNSGFRTVWVLSEQFQRNFPDPLGASVCKTRACAFRMRISDSQVRDIMDGDAGM